MNAIIARNVMAARSNMEGMAMTRRPALIPSGSWPRRMGPDLAAGYVGENSVDGFLRRVRNGEYPKPQIAEGRRLLWLRDDLDAAILPPELATARDLAEDL
jgi:hypothetical protein